MRIRDVRGRGLLVSVWLNHQGPFTFAVDTGAGVTLVGADVARRAGLAGKSGRRVSIGGLSNAIATSGEETTLDDVALGVPNNLTRSGQRAFIVTTLPRGLDGILDPTETFAPLGYVIDIAGGALVALDSTTRLRPGNEPEGGTVVRWIREGGDKRPFVRLGDSRLALIDTGSGFGLGVTGTVVGSGAANHRKNDSVRDLNGGAVEARRVEPTTVSIGSLVLRNVPTEVLIGAHDEAPVILGRGALYPFRITFDPVSRLIEIAPSRER
ncbi:MAG TPA: aspartyl protease family protein [Pyrinomonadaceae bacterium]|nr:aspartyl protease family protein [Pyrinomonadaceae bacterium]